jgi:hypothetical protein
MEKWKKRLKKLILDITESETWAWNPDARHPRIEGQFGSDVRVFDPTLVNLVLCFDISEQVDFLNDYGEAVSFVDNLFHGVGRKFRWTHFSLWAKDYYLERPKGLSRPVLLSKLDKCYQNGFARVDKRKAFASSIFKPFFAAEEWAKLRPDLLLIFTRGNIENDLDTSLSMKFKRLRKKIIWVWAANDSNAVPSSICAIDPLAEKRLVQIN